VKVEDETVGCVHEQIRLTKHANIDYTGNEHNIEDKHKAQVR